MPSASRRASDPYETAEQRDWLRGRFADLTEATEFLSPSEWAEKHRYLPQSVTQMPGQYSFDVAPYLREIVDCFSVDSPVREIAVMKGAQVGYTVGVLENVIGYLIDHVKTAPTMFVTADAELAKLRLETNIIPMIQHSGLEHLIKSSDERSARKTGQTNKKIEWAGGGYLVPFGAQNANKLRSLSIQFLLCDENDGWPDTVGKDGDPTKLVRGRTNAYETSRKIGHGSTPLLKGQSKIDREFKLGDQRYYFVCCLECGHSQTLRWRREDPETGEVSGIVWEVDELGNLVPGSSRYLCEHCGHAHTNDDKTRLLDPENGAEWRPTAVPSSPDRRSYHISALYSPVGMQSWDELVKMWLEAWDVEKNRPKDNSLLQVFYNNGLGETFEVRGDRVKFEQVSPHRRDEYLRGTIVNEYAVEVTGSPILLVTGAVDVHGDNLRVATYGWCRNRRAFLIDNLKFDGDTEQLDNPATWGKLRELINDHVYIADDGKEYQLELTLVDSGYLADQVYEFCAEFPPGLVAPVKGQGMPPKSANIREFTEITTKLGTKAFGITVDLLKDRWSAILKREWNGQGQQPFSHYNVPRDITDDELKELTAEVRVAKKDPVSGRLIGWEWRRPGNRRNEMWDLLIYNNAALEILAHHKFKAAGIEIVDWMNFWEAIEHDPAQRMFTLPS